MSTKKKTTKDENLLNNKILKALGISNKLLKTKSTSTLSEEYLKWYFKTILNPGRKFMMKFFKNKFPGIKLKWAKEYKIKNGELIIKELPWKI
jgi:hypothetical protein